MAELKIKIDSTVSKSMINFINLLETRFSELPKDFQDAILLIEEGGLNDIDYDAIQRKYGQYEKYQSSFNSDKIVRVNKILKKVVYIEDGKELIAYPEHFWHSFDGFKVVEW